jgi:hypothetical protein
MHFERLTGNTIRATITWTDADEAPVDPATTLCRIAKPDGTIVTPLVIPVPPVAPAMVSGAGTVDFVMDQPGHWTISVRTTGPRTEAEQTLFCTPSRIV